MEEIMLEIYGLLKENRVLDMTVYNELIKKYDQNMVNVVIEQMIDMDENFISKVDISKVVSSDKKIVKTVYDSYSIVHVESHYYRFHKATDRTHLLLHPPDRHIDSHQPVIKKT